VLLPGNVEVVASIGRLGLRALDVPDLFEHEKVVAPGVVAPGVSSPSAWPALRSPPGLPAPFIPQKKAPLSFSPVNAKIETPTSPPQRAEPIYLEPGIVRYPFLSAHVTHARMLSGPMEE
jgi:hypothetical protein